MSPSRRSLLRAGLVGIAGPLAGCSTDEATTKTRYTETTAPGTTTGRTPRTTTETRTTTQAIDARAVEFVHQSPVFDWGVSDAGSVVV